MSSNTYFVIVDDTDPKIEYFGEWEANTNDTANMEVSGPPYNSTEHYSTASTLGFDFKFNGTYVEVRGAIDGSNESDLPQWECLVDGEETHGYIFPSPPALLNGWRYCEMGNLDETEHTLSFFTISTTRTIWTDYIRYEALPDAVLEAATIKLELTSSNNNVTVSSSGWEDREDTDGGVSVFSKSTHTLNSSMVFNFYGTAFTMVGVAALGDPNTASYELDGDTGTFDIPSTDVEYILDQVLVSKTGLRAGDHTLRVTFTGDEDGAPLVASGFYVTTPGAPSLHAISQPGSSGTNTKPSSDREEPKVEKSKVPAMIGGIFAGLVVCVLSCLLLCFCLQRRKARKTKKHPTMDFTDSPSSYRQGGYAFLSDSAHGGSSYPMAPTSGSSITDARNSSYQPVYIAPESASVPLIAGQGDAAQNRASLAPEQYSASVSTTSALFDTDRPAQTSTEYVPPTTHASQPTTSYAPVTSAYYGGREGEVVSAEAAPLRSDTAPPQYSVHPGP